MQLDEAGFVEEVEYLANAVEPGRHRSFFGFAVANPGVFDTSLMTLQSSIARFLVEQPGGHAHERPVPAMPSDSACGFSASITS